MRNYQHLRTYHVWSNLQVIYLEKIVTCYPQSDASDGIEQLASLFLVLYSILCSQWPASGKPWSATDDAAEVTEDFFTFLLLNQEHGVNNERSQSIQSVIHSKLTHLMWPSQKDRSMRKEKRRRKKVFLAHSVHLSVQYSIGPSLKVWYCQRPALFDCHLHSEIMDLYMPVVHVWNDVLPQGFHFQIIRVWNDVLPQGFHFQIISPVISKNHLLITCLFFFFQTSTKISYSNAETSQKWYHCHEYLPPPLHSAWADFQHGVIWNWPRFSTVSGHHVHQSQLDMCASWIG